MSVLMSIRSGLPVVAIFLLMAQLSAADREFEWAVSPAEDQGLSSAKLEAFRELLATHSTKALLVIRNDQIVLEWYAPGHSATKPHYTASMAKALVGGVSVALAITDQKLSLDDRAAKFIPQWRNDARKSQITLRQLGSHTSGLSDAEQDGAAHEELTGWKGNFWKRPKPPDDPFTISRDLAPLI